MSRAALLDLGLLGTGIVAMLALAIEAADSLKRFLAARTASDTADHGPRIQRAQ
jgi:hypothetical protein